VTAKPASSIPVPEHEAATLEAARRRLRRIALDLHDGPAQDVAALSADAALLEAELAIDLSPERIELIRGLAGEIRSRLVSLARQIGDLSEVLEPRSMLREPLAGVLAREAASFARRTGVAPTLDVEHDLGLMTASQQIALTSVAREALANVARHARATHVHVSARATDEGVTLSVTDDGRGFDVERRGRSAAARGRRGLTGMNERIHLLGGTVTIRSRKGGPTHVEATVPRWRPQA
jgi:signal transduction histidine kinase